MKKEFGKWFLDVSKLIVAFTIVFLLDRNLEVAAVILAGGLMFLFLGIYLFYGNPKKQQDNFRPKNRPKKKFSSAKNKPIKENSFLQDNPAK